MTAESESYLTDVTQDRFLRALPADMRKGCAFPSGTTVVEAAPQASGIAAGYFCNSNRKGESFRTSGGTAAILRNISYLHLMRPEHVARCPKNIP
jgi:hypothetical protein